jgi:hypothetical protein
MLIMSLNEPYLDNDNDDDDNNKAEIFNQTNTFSSAQLTVNIRYLISTQHVAALGPSSRVPYKTQYTVKDVMVVRSHKT